MVRQVQGLASDRCEVELQGVKAMSEEQRQFEPPQVPTPLESIRRFCVQCAGGIYQVEQCGGDKCLNGGCDQKGVCWFYPYRMGKGRPRVKTIRKICLWCQGSEPLVKECPGDCHLHPYRMGKAPNKKGRPGKVDNFMRKGSLSDE